MRCENSILIARNLSDLNLAKILDKITTKTQMQIYYFVLLFSFRFVQFVLFRSAIFIQVCAVWFAAFVQINLKAETAAYRISFIINVKF